MATRAERREATRARILEGAWDLSARQGLTGWTMRDLGAAVGMRAPSLYEYADSKNAIFDAMFADGYRGLLARLDKADVAAQVGVTPHARLRAGARIFLDFAIASPARFQLLFQYSAPGFVPSPESMGLAQEVMDRTRNALVQAGFTAPGELDLWTALITGLASQQVSNEPGGTRWSGLLDDAVDRFFGGQPVSRVRVR